MWTVVLVDGGACGWRRCACVVLWTFDVGRDLVWQVMMWIAMDPPRDVSAAKTIEAKVELLRCIKTLRLNAKECFLGQFGPSKYKVGQKEFSEPGYLDDETVPKDSCCPTFASLLLQVDNTRWRGVPFLMTAGKGLDERLCEVWAARAQPSPSFSR